MKNTLIGILIVVVIALAAYTISQKKAVAPTQMNPITSNTTSTQQQTASRCGLTIHDPLDGSIVTFPLVLHATVDNTQTQALGCSWTVFEAQAGTVKIKDQGGNILAQSVLKTSGNWMTSAPTPYTATIASLSNPSYTGPLTIMFDEEDVSGNGNAKSLVVNVSK